MPALRLPEEPAFAEVADAGLDAALTGADAKQIAADAAFAAVRSEEFQGFYKHGETVALPVSDADGYAYSRAECRYAWQAFWTGAAPETALGGTDIVPMRGRTGKGGHLLAFGASVDQGTGAVSCWARYQKEGLTAEPEECNDGIVVVTTYAKRLR